ncbi:outer membrane protein assembly factor BamB family protein [Mycolicibacterium neoaurum]|uniref:outer membrane protein assembly factor BamB family protein n=1 Tax=Mycolicibacterium neoaurum TaxID=1795 RepID=UPI001F4C5E89|nr:PQQ-binding-like beta-propeller repeat protein [Mycolicibacterium neoaurum]
MTDHDQSPADAAADSTATASGSYTRITLWPPFIPRDQRPRPPRLSRALNAAGVGMSLGAIAVIAYGFTIRIPHGGRAAETLSPVTDFFILYLILGSLTALSLLATAVGALTGRTVSHWAATLLAVTVAMSAWTYISSVPASIGVRLSGLGARPARELAQLAWPLLTVSAALILAGSIWAINTHQTLRRTVLTLLSPWTAAGIAVSMVAGAAVAGWWWPHHQTHMNTAERVEIPALPTTLGDQVAYSLPLYDPENIQAAGPGFVIFDQGGAITAFDGATGAQRWKATANVFPDGCLLDTAQSTGISAQSVVIAQCRRPQLHSVTPTGGRGEPVLMGFDANTGAPLWLNDDGFELANDAGVSDTVTAVVRRNEQVGSLDPHTGSVRWTRPLHDKQWNGSVQVLNNDIVIPPYRGEPVRVLDGDNGDERLIDFPVDTDNVELITLAADSGLLVVQTGTPTDNPADYPRSTYRTWSIDIHTGAVEQIDSVYRGGRPDFPRPGPLVQLGTQGRDEQRYVEVYSLPQRRLARVIGVSTSTSMVGRYAWAQIGANIINPADQSTDAPTVITVAPDGAITHTPSPCPIEASKRGGGILTVPGATLMLCPPTDQTSHGFDVLGMQ